MEGIKVCPGCNLERNILESICSNCGTDLTGIALKQTEQREIKPHPQQKICPDNQCGGLNDNQATKCIFCGTKLGSPGPKHSAVIEITWPWEKMPLNQVLKVGRDPEFSPLAENLSTYLDVSREHAILRVLPDGSVEIKDSGSKYGTLVNGQLIQGSSTTIKANTEISFSQEFSVQITFLHP